MSKDIVFDSMEEEYDGEFDTISGCDDVSNYIVFGELGLWDGNHPIDPRGIFSTLPEAIMYCWRNSGDSTLRVCAPVGDVISLTCSHHDGVNRFKIVRLTDLEVDNLTEGELKISTIIKNKGVF